MNARRININRAYALRDNWIVTKAKFNKMYNNLSKVEKIRIRSEVFLSSMEAN